MHQGMHGGRGLLDIEDSRSMTAWAHAEDEMGFGAAQDSDPFDIIGEVLDRGSLDADALETTRSLLARDPGNMACRLRLLTHHCLVGDISSLLTELAEIVARDPTIEDIAMPFFSGDEHPEAYERFKTIWLTAAASSTDLRVARCALTAIGAGSFEEGEVLVSRGLAEAPDDPSWLHAAAKFYLFHARRTGDGALFERALSLDDKLLAQSAGFARLLLLAHAIAAALGCGATQRARQLAEEALAVGPEWRLRLKHLHHHAHGCLGELVLREGDVEAAARHLLESADDVWDFHLEHFGPRVELAEALLRAGQREVVLEFQRRLQAQCPQGKGSLDRLARIVGDG